MTVIKNTMSRSLSKLEKVLEDLPEKAYDTWVDATPKRSGNARQKTRLKSDTIHADYAYANRLNQGSSRQAPKGMSEVTDRALELHLKKNMRK